MPTARNGKTLVGGLPWEQSPDDPPTAAASAVFVDQRPLTSWDAIDHVDPLSWRSLRRRCDDAVRRSPPVTVSVSLHVLVILLLAFSYSRRDEAPRPVLDLSFASTVVDEQQQGVEIQPPSEPVEETRPEETHTEKPPVEDPVAAAAMRQPEIVEPPGAATADVAAPVIGTLLTGREEGQRQALLKQFGGSDATEAAVARALEWIVRQQGRDGLWSLQGPYADRGSQENRLAATAMALLALQGAGNTPAHGRHRIAVQRAWKSLLAQQLPTGNFDVNPVPHHHTLYAHAQATIALCEVYGMTDDEGYATAAGRAIAFAVGAQGPDGGWRYAPGSAGDMSVTGWFMMALKSAEMAGLQVPRHTLTALEGFVDGVAVDGGSRYGYRREFADLPPSQVTAAVSAEGLLCRQFLGWERNDPRIVAGLDRLLAGPLLDFENDKDLYAWYYVSQVAHNAGGGAWERWNGRMRDELPARQVRDGPDAGSWNPSLDKWGHIGGRLYATCFCTFMLEVYYRHLPLYGGPR